MAPQVKIKKEQVLAAAVELVKEKGMAALNARSLSAKLHCSTQPIFSNYASMEELQKEVVNQAVIISHQYLDQPDASLPPYKAIGMAYIRFARQQPELFKLLFMRDRSHEVISNKPDSDGQQMAELISKGTGLSVQAAYKMHLAMWIFVHGLATMIVTNYLNWDDETVSEMLSATYQSYLAYMKKQVSEGGQNGTRITG